MFTKVVIGVVLVSIFPCESRHQRFFEVPFDDGTPAQSTQQFTSAAPPVHNGFVGSLAHSPSQHLASNQHQFQGNSRHQSIAIEAEQPRNSVLRSRLEDVDRSSFHGHLASGLQPTNQCSAGSSKTLSGHIYVDQNNIKQIYENTMVSGSTRHGQQQAFPQVHPSGRVLSHSSNLAKIQPSQSFDFGEPAPQVIRSRLSHAAVNTASHSRQLDATPPFRSSADSDYQLLNSQATLGVSKQPVNTFFGVEEPTLRVIDQSAAFQSRPSDGVSNTAHFIRAQPAVRAPISPPLQQIFSSQIPQLQRQEVNLHPRFPERPEMLITAQPAAPAPTHFFVNQRAAANQEILRRPNSNVDHVIQNQQDREEEIFKQQAQSAKYSFASQIDDSINGNQHQREEVRDGLSVKGSYSYSDGYVKRTVFYVADENGYRVLKQEEEPLGNGPQINPKGQANVSSYVAGNALQYSITADDIQQIKDTEAQQRHQS